MNLQEKLQKEFETYNEIKVGDEVDEDKLKELNDKTAKLAKDIDAKAFKISGLDGRKLSQWEKETVIMQIGSHISKAYDKTSVGKHY